MYTYTAAYYAACTQGISTLVAHNVPLCHIIVLRYFEMIGGNEARPQYLACSSQICDASCSWRATDSAEPKQTSIYHVAYLWCVPGMAMYLAIEKISPVAAAGWRRQQQQQQQQQQQHNSSTTGHTRPRPASMYARLIGLTLQPFVHVFDLLCVS